MQTPAITAAGERGLVRHLADGNPNCRGKDMVEHFHHVDLRDLEGLLAVAQEIPNLKGVFTAGTDFSQSVAYVVEALHLPGISFDVATKATDKGVMRETLSNAGVRVPRFCVVDSDDQHPSFPPPYVVKPVDNMGARGVVRVETTNDLAPAISSARMLSASRTVIVEELICGQEYSLDALVVEDKIVITGIGVRHIYFSPYFVELGHTIPAPISAMEETALVTEFKKAIRAIGITRGAAKGDIFLSHDATGRPYATIGEIAARLSGGYMSGWTFPYATGIPLTDLGIGIALGEPLEEERLVPQVNLVSAERALISAPGTIDTIEISPHEDDRIKELFINYDVGDTVAPPQNNVQKVANVIAVAESHSAAERAAIDRLSSIYVVLTPGNPDSDSYIFQEGWVSRYAQYRVLANEFEMFLRDYISGADVLSTIQSTPSGPIAVRPLSVWSASFEDLPRNHIGVEAETLAERMRSQQFVVWDVEGDDSRSRIFWRAFVSAGIQGVRYLIDSVQYPQGTAEQMEHNER